MVHHERVIFFPEGMQEMNSCHVGIYQKQYAVKWLIWILSFWWQVFLTAYVYSRINHIAGRAIETLYCPLYYEKTTLLWCKNCCLVRTVSLSYVYAVKITYHQKLNIPSNSFPNILILARVFMHSPCKSAQITLPYIHLWTKVVTLKLQNVKEVWGNVMLNIS